MGPPPKVYRVMWRNDAESDTLGGAWTPPTNRLLVCDHQYGDTLYLGVYKDAQFPVMMSLDAPNFSWWRKLFDPSSGSFIGVQTADIRDEAYAFGYFGVDDQIERTENGGFTFADCDDDWYTDRVTSLEYHPTDGDDLISTTIGGQDLLQTSDGNKPWNKIADIPVRPRCQLRVGDDVWIGSDDAETSPVRMYSSGSWVDKSNGLPAVAINDLELGY